MVTDAQWMERALSLAGEAERQGEVPVGALLVDGERVLAEGFNSPISSNDPTAHAEIVAIRRAAAEKRNYRLSGTTLYVTLEPCSMCAGAIVNARIERVVFGAFDERSGAAGSVVNLLDSRSFNHRCRVTGGVLEQRCAGLLTGFFQSRRDRAPPPAGGT